MKRLEEICIFIRNGLNIKNDKSKKGIPVTRIETISNGIIDINKTGYANIFDDKYIDYYLRQDDILMSHINSLKHLGKVGYCYYDMKIIHGMNLLNIRVNPNNVYPKYLYYYFKSNNFKIKLNKISKQSVNQSSFSISDLKKIRIDIIDLKKQKLIASKLDKVVEVISIRKKQIEELNNLIKSQFVEMFENKNYPKIKGKNLFIFSSGKFLESHKRLKEGIPVYGGNGIVWYTDKELIDYNTIVIGRVGAYCGNVKLVREPAWITDNAIYIKQFKKDVYDIDFLFNMMEAINFFKFAQKSGQPKITQKPLEEYNYIVPPIDEQINFSNIVKQIDKQKFESMIQLKMMEKIYNIINDRRRYV